MFLNNFPFLILTESFSVWILLNIGSQPLFCFLLKLIHYKSIYIKNDTIQTDFVTKNKTFLTHCTYVCIYIIICKITEPIHRPSA